MSVIKAIGDKISRIPLVKLYAELLKDEPEINAVSHLIAQLDSEYIGGLMGVNPEGPYAQTYLCPLKWKNRGMVAAALIEIAVYQKKEKTRDDRRKTPTP